jgi:DNA repair photolyase
LNIPGVLYLVAKSIQLKVEQGRVLVPIGEACPFGCKYCYTRGGEVGPPKVDIEDILRQLRAFANENAFETIQFGYDGDPFAHPDRGIAMLQRLAEMGKDINFSTKALIDERTLRDLVDIKYRMELYGNSLSALVSLSCWDSAHYVEPYTPTPQERMLTVKKLKSIGISPFIAVRPVLPHIHDGEYVRIVEEGMLAGCEGFILGPLYADDRGRFVRFIPPEALKETPSRKVVVPWSAHAPVWVRYEDENRLQRLMAKVIEKGGQAFLSSADAVGFVKRGRVLA